MGGPIISDDHGQRHDLGRLERAIRMLIEKYHALRVENAALRSSLEERDGRLKQLDGQLLEMNQRRQDAAKRIDDLIGQIEEIDARFGAAPE